MTTCFRLTPLSFALALALPVLLSACATKPPPDFGGRWKSVNHYADTPQAIPLHPAYTYYASPLDRTLKGLLERWARDSHMTLDYRNEADFTLHRPVADVHSDDLHAALVEVAALYAPQQIAIAVDGDRIVVMHAGAAAASAPTP